MFIIYLGALLVIVGVLFMAYKAIYVGRLSGASRTSKIIESTTLEPQQKSAAFNPKAIWPGLVLIVLGTLLLLSGGGA